MNAQRLAAIRSRLESAFAPAVLEIRDDSALHVGHPGARGGAGHFSVDIEADRFSGLTRIRRHRLVYDAVADMIPTEIHALSINARAPGEGQRPDFQSAQQKDE